MPGVRPLRILISGAGIAGPTLAYWLKIYGFEPVLLERSPRFRAGGYIIDFWGLGFDAAERMGLMAAIMSRGYHVKEVRIVNERGAQVGGFPTRAFDELTHGRYLSLPRGDLAKAVFASLPGVKTMFGDEIRAVHQESDRVRVQFRHADPESFDLVIGADGLHSNVRRLVFGSESRYESYLGYKVAAFEVPGYQPRDEGTYVTYTQVGQQVSRFSMRGDRTLFLFIFREDRGEVTEESEQKRLLRERFGNAGWECRRILEAMDASEDFYFDRVSQIKMPEWSRGRVALVGDAAFCVSLLAGQGSSLAMAAAYILAGELYRSGGNHQEAFANYRRLFAPLVARKQASAERFAESFVPHSAARLFLRNQASRLLSIPLFAKVAFGRAFSDGFSLPDYDGFAGQGRVSASRPPKTG